MIQRLQSVFLFIIASLMIASVFLKSWEKTNTAATEKASLDAFAMTHFSISNPETLINEKSTVYIAALAILSALVALFSLFKYNNRRLQMGLGAVNSMLMAGTVAAMLITSKTGETWLEPGKTGEYQLGLYLPLVAMLCNIISNRLIRRDEKLVRSMDRIR